jgi:arylsulfatase B
MQWNGQIPAGMLYDKPVISLDILPTVTKAAGAEVSEEIDGVDLMPYLTGNKAGQPHESLYWRQKVKTALRMGDWKIVSHGFTKNNPVWELYNLESDISEKNNLKNQNPEKFKELYDKWNELNGQMMKPLF